MLSAQAPGGQSFLTLLRGFWEAHSGLLGPKHREAESEVPYAEGAAPENPLHPGASLWGGGWPLL